MGTRLFFLRLNIDLFSLPLQDIDGQALLLLTLPTVQECMDLKLGPAIKLCHQIERVKVAFYRQYANWSRSSTSPTEHPGSRPASQGNVGCWIRCLLVENLGSFGNGVSAKGSFFYVLESCFGRTQKTRTCGLISGTLSVWKCDAALTKKEEKLTPLSTPAEQNTSESIRVLYWTVKKLFWEAEDSFLKTFVCLFLAFHFHFICDRGAL